MLTEVQLTRILARHTISRAHLLTILIFLRGHPEQSLVRALFDFVRGVGPAAAVAGRARSICVAHA